MPRRQTFLEAEGQDRKLDVYEGIRYIFQQTQIPETYDPLGPTSLLFPLDAWNPKPRLVVLGPIPAVLEDLVRLGCQQGMYVEYHGSSPQDESMWRAEGTSGSAWRYPLSTRRIWRPKRPGGH